MDEYWKKVGRQTERVRAAEALSDATVIARMRDINIARRRLPDARGRLRCSKCQRRKKPSAFPRHINAFTRQMGWCRSCLVARPRNRRT